MVCITRWSLVAVLMVFLAACSAGPNNNKSAGTAVPVAGDTTAAVGMEKAKQSDDTQRLAALWEKRMQQRAANDYPIGPGDVLEINVAGVEEMKNISERVTGDETVSLPFVGIINTRGFTDKTLRSEIRRRLETNYVRNPQVSLFVKEFRSRQVAVIGAVQKPGLYNLASSADTVMSMISQAGGMRTDAAEHILFLPAEPAAPDKAKEVISAMPVQLLSQDPSPLILKNVDPIVINLDSVNRSGNQRYLNMPALPGDIVMVPGGGEVLIQGWVEKPGAYKITSGLTILGAMAAAGGTSYPADTASVELIRTNPKGHKSTFVADLDAIKSGAQPDVPLREGDVINVVSYGPKLFAYGFYRFFTSVFNVGASANIPIR
ncbi:MAG: polysaccharide export protein [Deltaproteobacteria bacterium]|nr:MAG: polysaccharide export protein [Deltaproteobacteria bacterium]